MRPSLSVSIADLIAAADLAEHVRARHAAVFQQQLARAAGANAELVFLLADREPGEAALDEKRGDAAIAGVRIDGRKDHEQVGFVGVRDPQLAAGQQELVAGLDGARGEGERVAARPGFRQRVGANRSRRQLRQVLRLLRLGTPAQQRIDDERVLHVDEDADRRVDGGQRFDREHRVEEGAAGAAVRVGNLDAHHPQLEHPVDEAAGHLGVDRPFRGRAAGFPAPQTPGRCPGTGFRPRSGGSTAADFQLFPRRGNVIIRGS